MRYNTIEEAIEATESEMEHHGQRVHTERWQSWDISKRPEAEMVEVLHHSIMAPMISPYLDYYKQQIQPNLPWADNHFVERVSGYPMNPGTEWANWPWSRHANKHRDAEQFNHNYMERYWPKFAGMVPSVTVSGEDFEKQFNQLIMSGDINHYMLKGIRHKYGDLMDLVQLMAFEPTTRQGYFPVWFPEDTGVAHNGRKPCTIGYHFILRNNKLDVVYYIRSCDLYRHFRDDIYLTIRLVLWMIRKCRELNAPTWENVEPGNFVMHITSLHMFINDYIVKFGGQPKWAD